MDSSEDWSNIAATSISIKPDTVESVLMMNCCFNKQYLSNAEVIDEVSDLFQQNINETICINKMLTI